MIIGAIAFILFVMILLVVFGFVIGRRLIAVDQREEHDRADSDPYLVSCAARAQNPDSALIRDMPTRGEE